MKLQAFNKETSDPICLIHSNVSTIKELQQNCKESNYNCNVCDYKPISGCYLIVVNVRENISAITRIPFELCLKDIEIKDIDI